ncbi:unnamed protein product [Arctogadus glacialis]
MESSVVCLVASLRGCHGGVYQRKLYRELMVNYNRLERPVHNDSAPIVVELGLTLLQIIDVVGATPLRWLLLLTLACYTFGQRERGDDEELMCSSYGRHSRRP